MRLAPKTWAALLISVLLLVAKTVAADEWPSRTIAVVSPFATGTTNDIVAHTVLDPAGSMLAHPFVLENRPGDGGTLGVKAVVKSAPDGYTLLLANSAMNAAAALHKSLPYDILRDLVPVAMFGGEPSMLMAAPGKGYASIVDLTAAAKASPGAIKFGSVGIGSAAHIAGEHFNQMAGLNAIHVAYSGAADAIAELAAGRIDFYFVPIMPALPLITQGKAVPLAVSTSIRLQSLPGLPTLKESGYAFPVYLTWCGLAAPANTPPEIIRKLNQTVAQALELPAVRTKLLRTGYQPLPMSPEDAARFVADDLAAMIKLSKEAHMQVLD